jgi:uncharacterized cupredoxin-like copper-binding protein
MNRTTIKALFLLALIAFPISKVIAGISITPAFIRLSETLQGKTYNIPVQLTNQSAKKTEYFVTGVEAPNKIINGIPSSKIIKWVKIKPKKLTLQPGESRKILATVKIPKGVVGDYRIYLTFMQDPKKYELKIKKKKIQSQVGMMQLGKTSTRLPEFKTHIKALLKVNVPLVIRALKKGGKPTLRSKQISLSSFKVMPSSNREDAMDLVAQLKNKSNFDVVVKGGCTILNKKGTKKLMRSDLRQGLLVQPKTKTSIKCPFTSPLPRGRYQAQGEFFVTIKSSQIIKKITKRNKLKVDKALADIISGKGSLTSGSGLITPLLLSDNLIQQEVFNGKVRKIMIEVTNPTSKKMSIKTSFKLTNDVRVKTIFKPKRFKLKPGDSKRVSIEFKSKDKKKPIYGYVNFASKQAKGAPPASIPVVLIPEGLNESQKAVLSKPNAKLTAGGSRVSIQTNLVNSKTGKGALYVSGVITATNIESGITVADSKLSFSSDHSLPGTSVKIAGTIEFDKLPDGVYAIQLETSSDEGGLSVSKKFNLVVNRDIANKIKAVFNE